MSLERRVDEEIREKQEKTGKRIWDAVEPEIFIGVRSVPR